MTVRKAQITDIPAIMTIFDKAKEFMAANGNPNQWHDGYPWIDIVEEDVSNGNCYVIIDNNNICATFTFIVGEEPGYDQIRGKWLNDEPYGTIHRIATDGTVKGCFKCALDYCKTLCNNIKIDTHADNNVMQTVLDKNRFVKCGLIIGQDGVDRIAYQKNWK